jgi:hypothetical protein
MTDEPRYEYLDPVGVQNDGEPVAVATEPEPTPEPVEPNAEDAAPEPGTETPEQIEEKKRQTGSARAKAKLAEEREKNRQLLERLERLEAKGTPEPKQPAPEGKPKLDDFESFEAFNEALTDWKVDQKLRARESEAQTTKAVQSWEAKKEAARAEIEDFDEVLADMIAPAPVVVAVMNESEHTAKIAYHLAQHPDELRKINQMSPPAAALAIADIALQFKAAPEPKKEAPKTKAPAPINPVAARSAVPPVDPFQGRFETF